MVMSWHLMPCSLQYSQDFTTKNSPSRFIVVIGDSELVVNVLLVAILTILPIKILHLNLLWGVGNTELALNGVLIVVPPSPNFLIPT